MIIKELGFNIYVRLVNQYDETNILSMGVGRRNVSAKVQLQIRKNM